MPSRVPSPFSFLFSAFLLTAFIALPLGRGAAKEPVPECTRDRDCAFGFECDAPEFRCEAFPGCREGKWAYCPEDCWGFCIEPEMGSLLLREEHLLPLTRPEVKDVLDEAGRDVSDHEAAVEREGLTADILHDEPEPVGSAGEGTDGCIPPDATLAAVKADLGGADHGTILDEYHDRLTEIVRSAEKQGYDLTTDEIQTYSVCPPQFIKEKMEEAEDSGEEEGEAEGDHETFAFHADYYVEDTGLTDEDIEELKEDISTVASIVMDFAFPDTKGSEAEGEGAASLSEEEAKKAMGEIGELLIEMSKASEEEIVDIIVKAQEIVLPVLEAVQADQAAGVDFTASADTSAVEPDFLALLKDAAGAVDEMSSAAADLNQTVGTQVVSLAYVEGEQKKFEAAIEKAKDCPVKENPDFCFDLVQEKILGRMNDMRAQVEGKMMAKFEGGIEFENKKMSVGDMMQMMQEKHFQPMMMQMPPPMMMGMPPPGMYPGMMPGEGGPMMNQGYGPPPGFFEAKGRCFTTEIANGPEAVKQCMEKEFGMSGPPGMMPGFGQEGYPGQMPFGEEGGRFGEPFGQGGRFGPGGMGFGECMKMEDKEAQQKCMAEKRSMGPGMGNEGMPFGQGYMRNGMERFGEDNMMGGEGMKQCEEGDAACEEKRMKMMEMQKGMMDGGGAPSGFRGGFGSQGGGMQGFQGGEGMRGGMPGGMGQGGMMGGSSQGGFGPGGRMEGGMQGNFGSQGGFRGMPGTSGMSGQQSAGQQGGFGSQGGFGQQQWQQGGGMMPGGMGGMGGFDQHQGSFGPQGTFGAPSGGFGTMPSSGFQPQSGSNYQPSGGMYQQPSGGNYQPSGESSPSGGTYQQSSPIGGEPPPPPPPQ